MGWRAWLQLNWDAISPGLPVGGANFAVHKDGANQVIPQNVATLITFDATDWDTTGDFDLLNNRHVPQEAGKYQYTFVLALTIGDLSGQATQRIQFRKNGTIWREGLTELQWSDIDPNEVDGQSLTATAEMNGTTDYMEVWFQHGSNASEAMQGDSTLTWFEGIKVAGA